MKRLILTIFAITAPAIKAQVVDNPQGTAAAQRLGDYVLGQKTGRCLVVKCSIFTGYRLEGSPTPEEAALIQMNERLFASGEPIPNIARVAYRDPLDTAKAPDREIAKAWEGVDTRANTLLTVVLDEGGAPALVTSTPRDAGIIRSIAAEALLLKQSAGSIRDRVASLPQVDNPAVAGFLVVHLERIETIDDPDTSVTLLSQLLESGSVPPEGWEDVVDHIVLDYDRLTGGSQAMLVSRLAVLGKNADLRFASPGIRGLSKIGASDSSMWTLVPNDARTGIAQNYRTLVGKGAMTRKPALESALGIQ
jgi:hypothetical protein